MIDQARPVEWDRVLIVLNRRTLVHQNLPKTNFVISYRQSNSSHYRSRITIDLRDIGSSNDTTIVPHNLLGNNYKILKCNCTLNPVHISPILDFRVRRFNCGDGLSDFPISTPIYCRLSLRRRLRSFPDDMLLKRPVWASRKVIILNATLQE